MTHILDKRNKGEAGTPQLFPVCGDFTLKPMTICFHEKFRKIARGKKLVESKYVKKKIITHILYRRNKGEAGTPQ